MRIGKYTLQQLLLKTLQYGALLCAIGFVANLFQTRDLKSPKDLACLAGSHLTNLKGDQISATELSKPNAFVYFWAPWCSVCRMTAPGLARLTEGKRDFYAVGMDEDERERFVSFAKDVGFPDDKTWIGDDKIGRCFGLSAYPTYYFVSASGSRSLATVGFTPKPTLWLRLKIADWI